ncbi:MAG: LacI family DNA-binding transcriptional regulator [Janthinobacterium lividum]
MARLRTSVSVKDVAALAGVSVGTVSNVLNAPQLVSGQTRERVETAIEKLGWVRNESARQLRAGRSRSIGLVVMDLSNPFFTDVALGVEDTVASRGYIVQVGNSAESSGREQTQLDLFEQQRVRGLLFAPIAEVGDRVVQLRRRGIPVVVVDRPGELAETCSVSVDDVEGGRLAGQHLLSLGHRRLAVVGGPSHLHQVHDRRLGVDLATSAVAGADVVVISTPRLDVDSGVRAAGELAALPDGERPTAAFAINDLVAIGLLQGFVTQGLRVPQDIAIIGYDDIAFAAAAAVPLSSIRQPRRALGQRAAELLFAEIDAIESDATAEHEHEHVTFTPSLVVRRSTAPGTTRVWSTG